MNRDLPVAGVSIWFQESSKAGTEMARHLKCVTMRQPIWGQSGNPELDKVYDAMRVIFFPFGKKLFPASE